MSRRSRRATAHTYEVNEGAGKNLSVGTPPSVEQSLSEEAHDKGRRYLLEHAAQLLQRQGSRRKGSKKGSVKRYDVGAATRGWSIVAPHSINERREVYEQCGSQCFVAKPEIKNGRVVKLGFPICDTCHHHKCTCKIDPRGVKAAFRRARQYGHENIAKKAEGIMRSISPAKLTAAATQKARKTRKATASRRTRRSKRTVKKRATKRRTRR